MRDAAATRLWRGCALPALSSTCSARETVIKSMFAACFCVVWVGGIVCGMVWVCCMCVCRVCVCVCIMRCMCIVCFVCVVLCCVVSSLVNFETQQNSIPPFAIFFFFGHTFVASLSPFSRRLHQIHRKKMEARAALQESATNLRNLSAYCLTLPNSQDATSAWATAKQYSIDALVREFFVGGSSVLLLLFFVLALCMLYGCRVFVRL